jgi:hypothetical protein
MLIMIFVRESLGPNFTEIHGASVGTGVMGIMVSGYSHPVLGST